MGVFDITELLVMILENIPDLSAVRQVSWAWRSIVDLIGKHTLDFLPQRFEGYENHKARQKVMLKQLDRNSGHIKTLYIIGSCQNYDLALSGRFYDFRSILFDRSSSSTTQTTLGLLLPHLRRLDLRKCSVSPQQYIFLLPNHKNLEEIRFGPNQAWNNKCVQALIDIAPDMLRLEDLEISLTHHQDGELFTYQDLGFPKLTSLKIQMSSSRKFEYIAHLLERLQKLTILGPHVELVDHQLITSLKGLPNLTNLVLALKGPYDNKEPILLLSELICILVANHTELSCIDIYCGVGMYKWMSESRFRKVSKLPILQFNLPQEAGRSSLDTLEREGKVVHVRGRVPTGHGRVMEIECRHERRHIAGSSA